MHMQMMQTAFTYFDINVPEKECQYEVKCNKNTESLIRSRHCDACGSLVYVHKFYADNYYPRRYKKNYLTTDHLVITCTL